MPSYVRTVLVKYRLLDFGNGPSLRTSKTKYSGVNTMCCRLWQLTEGTAAQLSVRRLLSFFRNIYAGTRYDNLPPFLPYLSGSPTGNSGPGSRIAGIPTPPGFTVRAFIFIAKIVAAFSPLLDSRRIVHICTRYS